MSIPVLSSTFLLTLLLIVGLFFFIRASVKERTQTVKFTSSLPEESLANNLQQYFSQRAYRIADIDVEKDQIAFEGVVRPSIFLAIFLTTLCAVGTLCLSLVLSILFPGAALGPYLLTLLSPLAGIFYWRKAKRPEKVLLKIDSERYEDHSNHSVITVVGHRDELSEMQRILGLTPSE